MLKQLINENEIKYKELSENQVPNKMNFISHINDLKYEFDIKKYVLNRYSKTKYEVEIESYHSLGLPSILDLVNDYNEYESEGMTLDNIDINSKYSTIDICSLATNYNYLSGMYHMVDKYNNNIIVIKATLEGNSSIFDNSWLEEPVKLKYFLQIEKGENSKKFQYARKVNKLLFSSFMLSEPISVVVFVRKESGTPYKYSGEFKTIEFSKNGDYIILKSISSINETDALTYESNLDHLSSFRTFTDPNIYLERMTKNRLKQGVFREAVLNHHGETCFLCDISGKQHLIASHIKPYSVCNSKEAVDVYNGFPLCALHDHLFDKGFITIDRMGSILTSSLLTDQKLIYLLEELKIKKNEVVVHDDMKFYLDFHYSRVFLK